MSIYLQVYNTESYTCLLLDSGFTRQRMQNMPS